MIANVRSSRDLLNIEKGSLVVLPNGRETLYLGSGEVIGELEDLGFNWGAVFYDEKDNQAICYGVFQGGEFGQCIGHATNIDRRTAEVFLLKWTKGGDLE